MMKQIIVIQQILNNLYRLEIPLTGNPLKTLNSYVMISDTRNLIVDTGFNMPECLAAMLSSITELELDMTKTDVLSTHLHHDHNGLIPDIISETSKVYMGRIDREIFIKSMTDADTHWGIAETKYQQEGYPIEELARTRLSNPARKFKPNSLFDIIPLNDGDMVNCGDLKWEVILTPGHTPGHICLYETHHKILIAGDHILFDITPNITWWEEMDDSLGSYLTSLDRVSSLEVNKTLTGHRSNKGFFNKRIQELQVHHAERLKNVLDIVQNNPYISGYEIASKMTWSIRTTNWADFPPGLRWFAVGEAISHIDHLIALGKLQRHHTDGINTYTHA